MDFEEHNEKMIQTQLMRRGINNERVLNAFRKVKRHNFVNPENIKNAYEDHPLETKFQQTISQPYMVALMTQILSLEKGHKVLEIGTGSGYQTCILAELVGESGEVYSIDRFEDLTLQADKIIKKLGYENIRLFTTDGSKGLPDIAPFDRIMVTAYAKQIPEELVKQLAFDGIMVIPIGDIFLQTLYRFTKLEKGLKKESFGGCRFVPLVSE